MKLSYSKQMNADFLLQRSPAYRTQNAPLLLQPVCVYSTKFELGNKNVWVELSS